MLFVLPLGLVLAANPYLGEGQKLFDGMRYPEAEARLRTAREVPTSTPEERRRVYDLLARSVAAQGRLPEAEGLYAELLAKDPDAPAPQGVSPKIRETFHRAKERIYPPPYAQLSPQPAAPGRLELLLVDPWQKVSEVVLSTSVGEKPFSQSVLTGSGRTYEAALPATREGLRYYVQARGADGAVLARLGTAEAPLVVAAAAPAAATALAPAAEVSAEPAGPSRWPAWLTGGVAVAAAAGGVALLLSSRADDAAAHAATEAKVAIPLSSSARAKAIGADVLFGAAVVAGAGTAVMVLRW